MIDELKATGARLLEKPFTASIGGGGGVARIARKAS